MRQMKVAHIITDLAIGGTEIMLLRTLRNFKSDRYGHFVVSLKPPGSVADMIRKEGFRVYTLNLNKYNFAFSFLKLVSILRKERPQIAHNYLFHADILGRVAAKAAKIPIIISSLRNENIGGRWREAMLKMTDDFADGITAVCRNVANSHLAKGTTRKKDIRVIYNGLEIGELASRKGLRDRIREELNVEKGLFLISTVAHLEPKKGHLFLFEAIKILKDRGHRLKFLVIGCGSEKENLEERIAQLRLEDEIEMMGERNDVADILAASDAFALASLWEGLPNALLEAMAEGLPVVATRVGGIPEVVTDKENGLLTDAKDSNAIADAVERIIREPNLRRHLSENAKDFAIRNLDIRKTVAETEKLYEELLSRHEEN